MSWESRKQGGLYYTRTRRINGRQVREYIGGGLIGELAAEQDLLAREQLEQKRQQWKAEKVHIRHLEAPIIDLDDQCQALMTACLEAAGYHQHHGEWRRRHGTD
jgi:hypothetical protein